MLKATILAKSSNYFIFRSVYCISRRQTVMNLFPSGLKNKIQQLFPEAKNQSIRLELARSELAFQFCTKKFILKKKL